MMLLNLPIQWYLNILNLFNISMILNKWIIQWFSFDVTEVEMIIRVQREIQGETDQVQEMKGLKLEQVKTLIRNRTTHSLISN